MVISFKSPELEGHLNKRDSADQSPSLVAKRDLERYYWLVGAAQSKLKLHTNELELICDALNGTWFSEPWSITALAADIQDSIRLNKLDEKWKVDGSALIQRLESLSALELLALVDRVEQYWAKS